MGKLGFREWFQDLKTQSKLMVGFGVVSVIILTMTVIGIVTLRQLSSQSQTVYIDYTIPLSDFSSMGTALTQHHELLLDISKTNRKEDFEKEVGRLVPLKQAILKHIEDYEATATRVSRSGRDETKDLALLKPVLTAYFQEADAALSAFIESFDKSQMTAEQSKEMRALGVLALTTNLTPTFEKLIGRHGEQVATMREIAKDLNDDSQTLAKNGTLLLLLGGTVAVALGLGIGFIMPMLTDSSASEAAEAAPDTMRILLIDDSLSIRKFVGKMLQGAGYEVETAVDGEEGLRKATVGGYRLIITDLEMPKLNGYEVIQGLRDRPQTKTTPILVMNR